MNVLARIWWIFLASIVLLLAALRAPEIQVGDLTLQRGDPEAFTLFLGTGFLAAALLVGALLIAWRVRAGVWLCQWWGAIYSVVILVLLYANLDLLEPFAVLIMGAFSAAWYWGVRRSARDVQAIG